MSLAVSYEAAVASMVSQGVPRDKAERNARDVLKLVPQHEVRAAAPAGELVPTIALPFLLTIPWSILVSDNDKDVPIIRWRNGEPYAAKKLTARYSAGKKAIRDLAGAAVGDAVALTIPLMFIGHVYRPSHHRNDASNFSKIVHDALEGVVYRNDGQFYRSTWCKDAEPDIDRPRAEIEIQALPSLTGKRQP